MPADASMTGTTRREFLGFVDRLRPGSRGLAADIDDVRSVGNHGSGMGQCIIDGCRIARRQKTNRASR